MFNKFIKKGKQLTSSFDLFSNTQFLRYNKNSEYTSFSNGAISLIFIAVFSIFLIQGLISAFAKQQINSKTTITNQIYPKKSKYPFELAIAITGLDLNAKKMYFDIALQIVTINQQKNMSVMQYPLVPCDIDQWIESIPQHQGIIRATNFQNNLCLPSNYTMEVEGAFRTSQTFISADIYIYPCANIFQFPNRTCATYSQMVNLIYNEVVYATFYFTNPVLNPTGSNYLSKTLISKYVYQLAPATRGVAEFDISDFVINTDQSLWPWKNIKKDMGGIINGQPRVFGHTSNYYFAASFQKSPSSIRIERTFTKFSDVLSYVGGLFTTVIGLFFLISKYNQSAYEVDAASHLYKKQNNKPIQTNYFNFFTFLGGFLYSVINYFKKTKSVELFESIYQARDQLQKQLDVRLFIRRLIFLQNCMEYLFQDFQLKCIHLKRKFTIRQAALSRQQYSSKKKLHFLSKPRSKQSVQILTQTQTPKSKQIILKTLKRTDPQSMNTILPSDRQLRDEWTTPYKQKDDCMVNNSPGKMQYNPMKEDIPNLIKISDNGVQIDNKMVCELDCSISSIDSSQLSQTDTKQFYNDMIISIQRLEQESQQGKLRSKRIYADISKEILQLTQMQRSQLMKQNEMDVYMGSAYRNKAVSSIEYQ